MAEGWISPQPWRTAIAVDVESPRRNMHRFAPFLAVVLIAVGVWWEIVHVPPDPPRKAAPRAEPAALAGAVASRPVEGASASIPTAAFTESAPTAQSRPESAPASRPFQEVVIIEVVREDGRPINGANVVVKVPDAATVERIADTAGIVEIPAQPNILADVEVSGPSFGLFSKTLALDPGRQKIVVPDGDRVAGRVVVDGRAPAEPITLSLHDHGVARTAAEGRFEFFNVAKDWHGTLYFDQGFRLIEKKEDWFLELPGPNPNLTINVTELPVIKGRIVAHGTREPIQGAVLATLTLEHEAATGQWGTDKDGYFRVAAWAEQTHAKLEISNGLGVATRTIEISGPIDSVRDLGDVELAPVRTIHLRVKDREGTPVAGAIAGIDDTRSRGKPTDTSGGTWLVGNERGGTLRVVKPGHATVVMPIPDEPPTPMDVVLPAGNLLVIEAQMHDGSVPPDNLFHVRLRSTDPMFTGPSGMTDSLLEEAGASSSFEQSTNPDKSDLVTTVEAGRRITFAGFRPGASLTIELLGATLHDVVDRKYVSIPAEGTINVTLRSTAAPQVFRGRVRTIDGAPIDKDVGVHLFLDDGDEWSPTAYAMAEGQFEFPGIFAPAVGVHVSCPGFVSLQERDVPVPPPGAFRDFILTPTCDITIELVDESGRRVEEMPLIVVRPPGSSSTNAVFETTTPGQYFVEGIEPGTVEILVTVGVAHVELDHDARIPHVRVVIPSDGVAEMTWRRLESDPADTRIALYALGATTPGFDAVPDPSDPHPKVSTSTRPGFYFAVVEAYDAEFDVWQPLAASIAFEIAARMLTTVEIER
jgi:hypothetical protein